MMPLQPLGKTSVPLRLMSFACVPLNPCQGLLELEPVLALESGLSTFLSTLCIQWHHVSSLTLVTVSVVTPRGLANSTCQSPLFHTSPPTTDHSSEVASPPPAALFVC